MSINERIRMIIHSQNLSASAFSEIIGVQRSNVSHVLSGRNKPSFEFIEKIILTFPNVSSHWLITGKHASRDQNTSKLNNKVHAAFGTNSKLAIESVIDNEVVEKVPEDLICFPNEIEKVLIFYRNGTFKSYVNT
jgi:plasmid maintenance system antidote protein VapI